LEATAAVQTSCGGWVSLCVVHFDFRKGEGQTRTYHIWRGHVVQESRNALLPRRHNRDVENPLASVKSLFKGQVSNIRPDTLLQDLDVEEIALFPEPLHPSK
jgi:hypothetical protein